MIVNTKRFGPIKAENDQVITFVSPLFGFEGLARYIFVQSEEDSHPFEFLQSVEDENLTFILTDPFVFFKDYEFQLEPHWIEALGVESEMDLQVMVVVTVRSTEDITCNLKAPVVLNRVRNVAAQIILDNGGYSTKKSLLERTKGEDSDVDPIQE
ncbi:flagellar assembly protein FliW [Paenibacillus sp. MDMC362]|uniref:flagellar assembly protein FliW n=1 Tax=Paenibacillus sp. MDMC362 TaxID=2977365 RepID=UPI000DC40DF0|nr:flagellar assembly protein FliW [Paenibacillus sp. MDMC362]RAR42452.1 flagellar assembly protein FliW [Paenibacillus sp. MDMC362]